jgi:hypothetical protein
MAAAAEGEMRAWVAGVWILLHAACWQESTRKIHVWLEGMAAEPVSMQVLMHLLNIWLLPSTLIKQNSSSRAVQQCTNVQ